MIETTPTTSSQPKPTVRYHGGTHYSVSSRTRAGYTHHVNTLNLTCSCEAGRAGRRCWALAVALQYEAWRRQQQEARRRAEQAEKAACIACQQQAARKATGQASVPPVPAPAPATPLVQGDWHDSAAYRGLAQAFE